MCKVCSNGFEPVRKSNPNLTCSYRCAGILRSRLKHPNLKEDYFREIDTKVKAYWLGFILADGNLTRTDKNDPRRKSGGTTLRFSLAISKKNAQHLVNLMLELGVNPKEMKSRVSKKYGSPMVEFSICNRVFCEFLNQAGCIPAKSNVLRLPKLGTQPLDKALLLGYFDGDGTLSGKKRSSPVLVSGSPNLLKDIKERFGLKTKIGRANHSWRLCLSIGLLRDMTANLNFGLTRKRIPLETPLGGAS